MKTPEQKAARAEYNRRWAEANKERIAAQAHARYLRDKAKRNAASKAWYEANKEFAKERNRAFHAANPDASARYSREWRGRNPEQRREVVRRSDAKRRSTIAWKLHNRIRVRVMQLLKPLGGKRGKSLAESMGWTIEELKSHIERQFTEGMSWDALARGDIHIDHIVPLSSFTITGPDDPELRRAWALTNLRPLWAADNLRKHAKRTFLI